LKSPDCNNKNYIRLNSFRNLFKLTEREKGAAFMDPDQIKIKIKWLLIDWPLQFLIQLGNFW
jgi:hypothetical protein